MMSAVVFLIVFCHCERALFAENLRFLELIKALEAISYPFWILDFGFWIALGRFMVLGLNMVA